MSAARIPVLYLAPWVDFGGSDKGTIDWFKWLDRHRFAPSLVTTQPSRNSRLDEVTPFAEEIWPLPELFTGTRYAEFIVDFIRSRQISIVHVMNSRLGFDLLPDLRSLDDRPRIVVQLHVEELARDGYVRYVTTRYGNLVDCFSVTSDQLAVAVRGYGVPRDRIEVIPTGVDGEREFSPELVSPRAGVGGRAAEILYPGRLVEQKDPLLMVEVARELQRRRLDFRLHVVGEGELEPEVRRRVAEHRLEERVRFEPATTNLAPWYAACDLLLMTSRFEGVPYVIYEALAMRVPVIAPALAGNVELMSETGGTLVSDRASTAFADALEPLIRDRGRRERIGAEGRALVLERYSLREMADRHAQLYDSLLAGTEIETGPDVKAPQVGLRVQAPQVGSDVQAPQVPLLFPDRPSRGTPLVSVLTPCFNHGRWLRECIDSVRAQTYPSVEIIVVDDGSTEEETKSYLDQLDDDATVKLIRLERNSGPSVARNRGLEQATGRYILPLDADNLLLPDAITRLVSQLQGCGERTGFIYPTIQYFGNREDYFEPPAFNGWLLTKGNYIDTCALIDRTVFDAGMRYPADIVLGHEDWDFFLTLLERGVYGEPSRGKTLLYRKHGFTRSDVVDWSMGRFHGEVPARHPLLFPGGFTSRGDNPHVRLKARWAPALTVIALQAVQLDSPDYSRVLQGLQAQHLRDFELYITCDREPVVAPDLPPVRSLPERLAGLPGEALMHALERTASPHVVVTYGTGAELLADGGSLERLIRLLEHGAASGVIGFSDGGSVARFPWAILPGGPLEPHSIAWSRRHIPLRKLPARLDVSDPIGDLGRWYQLQRISVDWRHLPLISPRQARRPVRRARLARVPRSRPELSERHSRMDAEALLPGGLDRVPRWQNLPDYAPPCTLALMRHRRVGIDEWTVTTSQSPPDQFEFDRCLGLVHWMAFEGTSRIVEDADSGWRAVPRGGEPDAVELERTLGYADQVAFPLLEPLMLCRHARSGARVLVCGPDDPLRTAVEWPQLSVLGWIDRWPVNPAEVPRSGENTAWLRGLLRTIDYRARRHRVALGTDPIGEHVWELGALLDRDPGAGIAAWVDDAGRLHTQSYHPGPYPFSPRRTLRWVAAPAAWRDFGRATPRMRAAGRRAFDAVKGSVAALRAPSPSPTERAPQGWLLREDGPHRVAIYSALHAVTSDQLVTRDPSEARELGYEATRLLGYALAVAPVTARLARPKMGIPWASRFGEMLTHGHDPLRWRA